MNAPTAGSAYGGRRPESAHPRTPERMDMSQSSGYSDASSGRSSSSSSSSRNPLRVAATAIRSCFTPGASGSPGGDAFLEFSEVPPSVVSNGPGASGRRKSTSGLYSTSNNSTRTQPGGMTFTMAAIQKATRNFSLSFKIGQGGFGTVYKGRLQDGTFVAIKRAKKGMYDKHLNVEFNSEISTLAQIEHLNLVRFMGYLESEDERIVVVEYVSNGTLREHLDCMRGNPLDLGARLDIATDVAHAVTYLHMYAGHPIIHRDIKSSNILLTENLRAKVADFGFARMATMDDGKTHVSTQIKGTAGYLDPEYLRTFQLTDKSDVYSFGVLLVELISGRRPIESKREVKERLTPKWAIKKFVEGRASQVLDPNLLENPATNLALEKILELAMQCLAPNRHDRPSMRRCAEILWGIRKDYREVLPSHQLSQFSHSQRRNSLKEGI